MTDNRSNDMKSWWHSPLGEHVMAQEREVIADLSKQFYGYFQLQQGGVALLLPTVNRPVSQSLLAPTGDVNASPEALPFKSYSIDNMLLLHVLEYAGDPHQVLREAERVLAADGKLILCCFNPFSLWGLRRLFSWQDAAPWQGHFFTRTRIKDWLALLNFEATEQHHLIFRPPFKNEKWLISSRFIERWGRRLWPWFGGVTVMVATKRTIPLTPLRQPVRKRQLFPTPGIVNKPIARDNNNGSR